MTKRLLLLLLGQQKRLDDGPVCPLDSHVTLMRRTLVMGASMVMEWILAMDECLRWELPVLGGK